MENYFLEQELPEYPFFGHIMDPIIELRLKTYRNNELPTVVNKKLMQCPVITLRRDKGTNVYSMKGHVYYYYYRTRYVYAYIDIHDIPDPLSFDIYESNNYGTLLKYLGKNVMYKVIKKGVYRIDIKSIIPDLYPSDMPSWFCLVCNNTKQEFPFVIIWARRTPHNL
jgi:hypothetical protein